jgi:hypothetical protein
MAGPSIGSGIGALSGLIGSQIEGGMKTQAGVQRQKDIQDQIELLKSLGIPDITDLQYQPAQQRYMGDVVAPDVYLPGSIDSRFEDISVDPKLRAAQMAAMGSMDEIIQGGGRTDMDRLNELQARQAADQQASQQQADIQQDMARRGMSGSGQELLAKLSGSQSAVNRAAGATQQQAALAKQRALEAIMNKGDLAGNLRSQDVGEQERRAQAADAIAKFNTQNMMNQQNLGAKMGFEAGMRNADTRQGVEGSNVGYRNTAAQYNTQAPRDLYSMQAGKTSAIGNVMERGSQETKSEKERKAEAAGKLFRDFGQAGGSFF